MYLQNGTVDWTVNQRGAVTENFYDLAGRVTASEHRDGILDEKRVFTYDRVGNVLSVRESTSGA